MQMIILIIILFECVQPIIDQFQAYHVKIDEIEEIKDYIVKTVKDDPATVAEVQDKLEHVQPQFDQLHTKVIQRQTRLQNAVIQGQDYQLSLEELEAKLNEMEKILDEQEPVNAKYNVAAQQKLDHDVSARYWSNTNMALSVLNQSECASQSNHVA